MNQDSQIVGHSIVESFRQGDELFIKQSYQDHYGAIENMILQNSGSREDAKDVYQEAFIVFYEKTREEAFKLSCTLGTYLYAVARNLWLKKLKKKGKVNIHLEKNEIENIALDIEDDFPNEWDAQELLVKECVMSLGEPCNSILLAFYYEKQSMAEITEQVGYPNTNRTKSQKYKCMQRLRKKFSQLLK